MNGLLFVIILYNKYPKQHIFEAKDILELFPLISEQHQILSGWRLQLIISSILFDDKNISVKQKFSSIHNILFGDKFGQILMMLSQCV